MRPTADSCLQSAEASSWSPRRLGRHWNCWTKLPQPLRREWSGKNRIAPRGRGFMNQKLLGIAGILVILGIAFILSANRKAIRLRIVGAAFALQAAIALFVFKTTVGVATIQTLSNGVAN